MKKKHIVIFGVKYFPSRGGTSRVVENLLEHLKDDFRFTIYCYKHPNAARHMKGVNVVEFSETKIKGLGVFIYYFKCCMHVLFKGKFDLIHVHKTDAAFFIPFLKRKAPVIATSHALPYMNDKWSSLAKRYFHLVEKIYMRSDITQTSIAQPQADYYEEKYGSKVIYIPNGVEPGPSFDPEEADELLAAHGVSGEYMLFAARRIIPLKGLHHLIEALNQMDFKGTLVVAGEDDQLPEYTKKLKSMGSKLNIKFVGYVGSRTLLSALVSKASLFVFPSEIEGMSMML
ncbi:MAG: glycosyltransferase family 4 protein, partial [Bacteroidota bacterium]